mgnify:CR=1 FL=1
MQIEAMFVVRPLDFWARMIFVCPFIRSKNFRPSEHYLSVHPSKKIRPSKKISRHEILLREILAFASGFVIFNWSRFLGFSVLATDVFLIVHT